MSAKPNPAEINKINLSQTYQREIFGLGEIYEIMSVERLRKKLSKKHHSGTLYLASNQQHGNRGMRLEELAEYLTSQNGLILEKGLVDSPPWNSAPLEKGVKKQYNKLIIVVAKTIFYLLIRLEFLWRGQKKSHMVFGLVRK
ncbi:MAG: hypothetical protein COY66_00635 [Candidatus Kerfeldbacteria bacterium CG_4_10_14_0_8_um_filter_42_10]|uniref:Uncharacterized protein n=1 Tax=Candidatus Kerfeldbacteria bacterium CG_4_10_14_0_8_um_filter_42_10 TaxID=2014248 RepID=A0A2M7RKH0_9BACT|nr:MAG: hypothetical protein COY66_00635 [Candidatus Kerfeldbacteria bacterium CG_4_10_14_0_8_um_filter_42_10]